MDHLFPVVFDDGYFCPQVIGIYSEEAIAVAAALSCLEAERAKAADPTPIEEDGDVCDFIPTAVIGFSFGAARERFVCVTVQKFDTALPLPEPEWAVKRPEFLRSLAVAIQHEAVATTAASEPYRAAGDRLVDAALDLVP